MSRLGNLVRNVLRQATGSAPTGSGGTVGPAGFRPEPFVPRGTVPGGTAPTDAPPAGAPTPPSSEGEAAGVHYAPDLDGAADPGEVVWAWVPYEEDASQGKDRPVLVIGRQGHLLLALQLTSQDHDRDAEQEARWGRHWMDIGTGDWDRERRPSEVRLDRLLRLEESSVRREGAVLARPVFDEVIREARAHHEF